MAEQKTSEYWPRLQLTRAHFCAMAVNFLVKSSIEMGHGGISTYL